MSDAILYSADERGIATVAVLLVLMHLVARDSLAGHAAFLRFKFRRNNGSPASRTRPALASNRPR